MGPTDISRSPASEVFEQALDAMLIADDERVYIDANPAACALLRLPREQLIGRRIDDFAGPLASELPAVWRRFLQQKRMEGEYELHLHDGAVVAVEFRASANLEPGRHLSIMRDITARRLAERERAEEIELRERLLAVVGHDLRNPLNAAVLTTGVLAQAQLSPHATSLVARLGRNLDRMASVMDVLLDLGRLRSRSDPSLNRAPADLAVITSNVIDELAVSRSEAAVELTIEGPTTGEWDAGRLARLVANLLGNALEHGTGKRAEVSLRGRDRTVELRVHNQGPPIAPDVLSVLFDAFRSGADGSEHSIGLGLFISREIVSAHGGTIEVISPDRDGVTVVVRLPR